MAAIHVDQLNQDILVHLLALIKLAHVMVTIIMQNAYHHQQQPLQQLHQNQQPQQQLQHLL